MITWIDDIGDEILTCLIVPPGWVRSYGDGVALKMALIIRDDSQVF